MSVMLANKYKGQDPTGWWMSEKLDGVRAIYHNKILKSRTGKEFYVPKWFMEGLPSDVTLDGELWEGCGKFQSTVGKVRRHKDDWDGVKYMLFDIISDDTFEVRQRYLNLASFPNHCIVLDQVMCRDKDHLNKFELGILKSGGEGVMLRRSGSKYIKKRSSDLLKVKTFHTDEAIVIGHTDGQGKHVGRVGAIICGYNGKTFKVGSGLSDLERKSIPKLGSIVTFSYVQKTDSGVPKFASFVAIRDYE